MYQKCKLTGALSRETTVENKGTKLKQIIAIQILFTFFALVYSTDHRIGSPENANISVDGNG